MQGIVTLKLSIPDWQSTVTAFSTPWSLEFIKLVSGISSGRPWCFWYKRINVCKIVWGSSCYKGCCGTATGKIVKTQRARPDLKRFILHTNLFTKILNLDVLKICWPFSSVQLLSRVWLFATPWITARQASLSTTISRSSLRLTSIESVPFSLINYICWPRTSQKGGWKKWGLG